MSIYHVVTLLENKRTVIAMTFKLFTPKRKGAEEPKSVLKCINFLLVLYQSKLYDLSSSACHKPFKVSWCQWKEITRG